MCVCVFGFCVICFAWLYYQSEMLCKTFHSCELLFQNAAAPVHIVRILNEYYILSALDIL